MTAAFEQRVALVTVAGRGIGQATGLQLASGGTHVALLARSIDQLEETAEAVRAKGGPAVVFSADLAETGSPIDAATRTVKELGSIDNLVNNAATVEPAGPTLSGAPASWSTALEVNVNAPVQLTLAVLPSMLERGWGRIVNVSSGKRPASGAMVGLNAYAATKAALEAHTLDLAAELAVAASPSTSTDLPQSIPPRRNGSAANRQKRSAPSFTITSKPPTSRAR